MLERYLTHANSSYREFAKMALNSGEPEKYKILEERIDWLPDCCTFVDTVILDFCPLREKFIQDEDLPEVLYCRVLSIDNTGDVDYYVNFLPQLPYCEILKCGGNRLKELPSLPYCRELYCEYNLLESLPSLPKLLNICIEGNFLDEVDLPSGVQVY